MKQSKHTSDKSRREFLKGAAVAGGAAAVVAATGKAAMASEQVEAQPESDSPKGYQETPHIRDYYRTVRG